MIGVRKNLVSRLALATAGTIFTMVVVKAEPSQAAIFYFVPERSIFNAGSLIFNPTSNLKGIGQETATLSELPGASFVLDYQRYLPFSFDPYVHFSSSDFSNPTFYFNNGNLVGINATASASFSFSDGRYGVVSSGDGTDTFSLAGAQYSETLSWQFTSYDNFGHILGTGTNSITDRVGNIFFISIIPFTAVPEPTCPLGAITALGLVVVVGQRKLVKKQRRQKAKV